eukprot:COSAG06_NODE_820_length_12102_cov_16.846205_1_plen_46_part_10
MVVVAAVLEPLCISLQTEPCKNEKNEDSAKTGSCHLPRSLACMGTV